MEICGIENCNEEGRYEIIFGNSGQFIYTKKYLCKSHYELMHGLGSADRYDEWKKKKEEILDG